MRVRCVKKIKSLKRQRKEKKREEKNRKKGVVRRQKKKRSREEFIDFTAPHLCFFVAPYLVVEDKTRHR